MAEAGWRYGMGVHGNNKDDAVERALKSADQGHPVGVPQSWSPASLPLTSGFGRTWPSPSASPAPGMVRPKASRWLLRKRPMTALEQAICALVRETRRELQISQSQLARLLNTTVRSIKRWERNQCKPTRGQRLLLWRLSDFAKNNGLEAFRARFMQDEEPRYNQPGPAGRLGELLFDSYARPRPTGQPGGLG
jgi:DNA-binding transcriptional regulator YiaG